MSSAAAAQELAYPVVVGGVAGERPARAVPILSMAEPACAFIDLAMLAQIVWHCCRLPSRRTQPILSSQPGLKAHRLRCGPVPPQPPRQRQQPRRRLATCPTLRRPACLPSRWLWTCRQRSFMLRRARRRRRWAYLWTSLRPANNGWVGLAGWCGCLPHVLPAGPVGTRVLLRSVAV